MNLLNIEFITALGNLEFEKKRNIVFMIGTLFVLNNLIKKRIIIKSNDLMSAFLSPIGFGAIQ